MIRKFISAVKFLTGHDQPGALLKVWPGDTFLVSYPKSGNTWLRFLVANLLRQDSPVSLQDADRMIPAVDGRAKRYFNGMSTPRIIKSHYPFLSKYKRVIYVVRDPRDVVMSQYHYQIKRGVLEPDAPLDRFVTSFLAGDVCPYGSWGENVGSWLAARRNTPNFLLLRYEDMLASIAHEATRVADFLGLELDRSTIVLAIERSTLESMRKLEKTEGNRWASTKGTRQDMSFFRSARTGEGLTVLPEECIARIEQAFGPLMLSLDYVLSSSHKASVHAPADLTVTPG
jgi:hypothetical protein